MVKYLLAAFLISLSNFLQAQDATLRGTITTADGKPAEAVTVVLEGTSKATAAGKKGNYEIKNIKPGSYIVRVSFVGVNEQSQLVDFKAGAVETLDFVLKENEQQLQEVVIAANKMGTKGDEFVAKMPLKNLENPQVYSAVSAEIMKQQVISNYDDALRNVPGITRAWESTGRGGDGGAYFSLRGFEAQPALVNGLPALVSGNLDPADVEEIQVIKGPSGTLFGASFYGYGGIINTITKKPFYQFGGEASYTVGSFGLNRLAVDVNTPLSKTKKIAFRLNAAAQTENSFQDAGFKKSFFIAPGFVYEVNDKLSFHVLAELLEEKRAVPPVFFNTDRESPMDFKNIKELNLNPDLSFTNNDLTIRNPRKNLQARMLYKFNSQWTSQTVFSAGNIKSDGIYTYIWGVDPDKPDERNYFYQYFNNQDYNTNTVDIQQNFNGDFKIGQLRNRVLIGLDYFNRTEKNNSSGWITTRRVSPQGGISDTDPSNPDGLNKDAIKAALAATEYTDSKLTKRSYSAYASDVINFTPAFSAMLSLRADYFDNKAGAATESFNQMTYSPKFGLVYQPVLDKVSIFANYMNAFFNVGPVDVYDSSNNYIGSKALKPERANQIEFGVKTNLFEEKLQATLSFYNTRVGNRVYSTANNNSEQGGKTQSRGVELDVTTNPVPGLNFIAGFSHGKIKVIEGNTATPTDFYNEVGRSPGGQGPQTLANLWATYKIMDGKLKDFGVSFGGNYAGVNKVIDNSVTGVFELPAYTLLNGGLFYNGKKIRVTANINNITNKQYYIGYWSVNPQKRRNFAASVAFKF
ncbi:TonB-dependent receptor [Niabella ginsenosidivorans]|uniref:TonB-dependent receptor n=1 Tax=Niabella ginsenosidivorans TaxID=1176587 RepID=A0A1A9I6T3_9BACT|nr:TonB-dependent receptor [Niabella ginsenosidivorans]ANH83397.1 TonB-dependent receptor [Niabella ginsenosidivorans]